MKVDNKSHRTLNRLKLKRKQLSFTKTKNLKPKYNHTILTETKSDIYNSCKVVINGQDGCTCRVCKYFHPYAEPNMEKEQFVCYSCRLCYPSFQPDK